MKILHFTNVEGGKNRKKNIILPFIKVTPRITALGGPGPPGPLYGGPRDTWPGGMRYWPGGWGAIFGPKTPTKVIENPNENV